jgi:hypothetical protein
MTIDNELGGTPNESHARMIRELCKDLPVRLTELARVGVLTSREVEEMLARVRQARPVEATAAHGR